MYMIRHKVGGTQDIPQISFEVVGSTGNIYKTVIGKVPTCDCPDVRFRKTQCKHICFGKYQPSPGSEDTCLPHSAQCKYQSLFFANVL
jgi:hypothetical protein